MLSFCRDLNERVLKIVETVLQRSSPSKPADAVLRRELKLQSGLPPDLAASAAEAVFAWYRWRGWLEEAESIGKQVQQALLMRDRFASAPGQFSDHELLARAIPPWVSGQMDIHPGWVRTLQHEPRLWLRARPGKGRELADKLGECWIPGNPALADAVEYRGREDLFRTPEFHAGDFEVQDVSSQIVGLACAPTPGETWWDACAGEGGKLLHLSDLMRNKGLIWASDRAEWRLKRLKLRAARSKTFNYRSAIWDGGERRPTRTKFDGVLIDAPCSGIGTWQRNPHARWTTSPKDVEELAGIQKQLLRNVAGSVKPGGRLVYAVCTLTRAETVEVASAFESKFPQFKRLPLSNPLKWEAEAGWPLWLRPEAGGNGMFVAAWVR
jgi:16S rRNA (cytosine967-C5)-methyltransferase